MKKLCLKILLFVVLIWSLDFAIGTVLEKMYFSIETGTSGAMMNHLLKKKYDVYVMGASGAQHGYIPEIIEKEIGMSVYNAGEDGTGIFYKYAILQLILERVRPKVIIWDITNYDYYYSPEIVKSGYILPYHDNPRIYELIKSLNIANIIVKASHLYPLNQKIAAIVLETLPLTKSQQRPDRGYLPIYGVFEPDKRVDYNQVFLDNLELYGNNQKQVTSKELLVRRYFNKFVGQCMDNGIKLIVISSPKYPVNRNFATLPLISSSLVNELSKKGLKVHHVLPIEYHELYRKDIYKDLDHLNDTGAHVFSKIVARIVKGSLIVKG